MRSPVIGLALAVVALVFALSAGWWPQSVTVQCGSGPVVTVSAGAGPVQVPCGR